jgi:dTDP-4-amino-4,6-dideoxyglucose
VLNAENVLARRYFYPGCHRLVPYSERATVPELPVTEAVAEEVLTLPTGTAVGPDDVAAVCELIRFAHHEAPGIMSREPLAAGLP